MSSGSVLAGRYRLAALLGEGGVGEVWSATHLLTGREVAIKRLLASRHGLEPSEALARFVLEAQSACAVQHPNVVEVLDFVEQEGEAPFLVMELLQGETLSNRLARENVLSPEQTAQLLLPVVSAVGTAHALGIIHRDLKPSNIFVSSGRGSDQKVKVLDFGIAKWIDAQRDPSVGHRTQTGSTLGTPSYMSPEQATAERNVDHRADIWSIGVILYECLSGVRPVEGENAAQMVMRLLSSGIIPIEHLVPGLPPRLAELIGRMLARDPRSRPENLIEVFALLQTLAGERAPNFAKPSEALTQKSPSSSLDTGAPSVLTPSERRGVASSVRPPSSLRTTFPWGRARAAAGILIALSLGALALRWSPKGPPPPVASAAPAVHSPVAHSPEAEQPATPPPAEPRAPPVAEASAALILPAPVASAASPAPAAGQQSSRRVSRPAPNKPAAVAPATPSVSGLGRGQECERSSDCASRVCLALVCE